MICRNGRGVIEDYGPSRARVQGYGGTMTTHAITPMRSPWSHRVVEPHKRMENVKDRPRCGKFMPRLKERCFRRAGHRDVCKSTAAVIADTARRRTTAR